MVGTITISLGEFFQVLGGNQIKGINFQDLFIDFLGFGGLTKTGEGSRQAKESLDVIILTVDYLFVDFGCFWPVVGESGSNGSLGQDFQIGRGGNFAICAHETKLE